MQTQDLRTLELTVLLAHLKTLVGLDRRTQADILRSLLVVDDRRAFVEQGYSSLWIFCHRGLGFSESMAQRRVLAVRVCRLAPEALVMIEDGRLSLCSLAALAGVLTVDNRDTVLAQAVGRSKREVEAIVAGLAPRTAPRDVVRAMVVPGNEAVEVAPTGRRSSTTSPVEVSRGVV